jgi:hypothetical protein
MMMNDNTKIRMLLHPSVSELDYHLTVLDIFNYLAIKYEDNFPVKWTPNGREILKRSGCFRDWVIQTVTRNNGYLLELFIQPNFPKQTLNMWFNWQVAYIEEDKIFPPKIVLQAAVNEWLHRQDKLSNRVSEVVTPS